MLLDLGALVLEMHRHGRFLPDGLQRRAAEAVGTDAELRALSRALDAGDGSPDLVAAGIAGNCERCGALHAIGASYCAQCGNELSGATLPRKAVLGLDPELAAGAAPIPRRTVVPAATAAAPPPAHVAAAEGIAEAGEQTEVIEPEPEVFETTVDEAEPVPAARATADGGSPPPPPPVTRRARATRVRQRLDEPARPRQAVPTGLLAGIAAGILVIVVGILVLSGGDGDSEPDRAAQAPARNEPEPPPPDEAPVPPSRDDDAASPKALEPVDGVTASDYDPSGDDREHPEEAPLAVDGDGATAWPTEEYDTGSLQKEGVGLALAPTEPLPARGLDLQTTTPGFDVTIYGAEGELPADIGAGWTEIASEDAVERRGRIDLDSAGRDFSHYLIWITEIPADEGKVEISEARLLR